MFIHTITTFPTQRGGVHCITMNSAYMGDIMALIGRHGWKINIVGTAQENRTGANTAEVKKAMQKNTYEAVAAW